MKLGFHVKECQWRFGSEIEYQVEDAQPEDESQQMAAHLATLEDLVEEIFGEIEDEHDRKRTLAKEVEPGIYEFSGRAEIENINEEFGLDLKESETYHTLGGYILENLGALPRQGDSFELGQLRFTIIRMATTRIELVRVEKYEK